MIATVAPGGSRDRPAGIHPLIVDLTLAVSICAALLLFEAVDGSEAGATLDTIDVLWCVVAAALILLRRFAPLPVLALSLAAGVWSLIPEDDQVVLRVTACLALYTVAATQERRIAWIAAVVVGGTLFATALITRSSPWFVADNLQQIAWAATAAAAGDAVRSRRAYVAARQERAAALQERRQRALEEVARRRVMEERLRIARELHDVIAHNIAVINVQAGVAHHLLRDDPAGAEVALAHVRRGAGTVLEELSGMLSVMRQSDESADATDPMPTLDRLDQLIVDFSAAGLVVDRETTGESGTLSPATALAAYRIVQESLTNAQRHGIGGRARLRIDYRADSLRIEIENRVNRARSGEKRSGHGILGMRERVMAAGGTIEAGPVEGGLYRVRVELPISGASS